MTTLLYKTKEPVVYNKGTIYEKREDTFLHSYYRAQEEAQKYVDELNATHPDKAWNGEKIDWNTIDYFFVGEQPLFDTTEN